MICGRKDGVRRRRRATPGLATVGSTNSRIGVNTPQCPLDSFSAKALPYSQPTLRSTTQSLAPTDVAYTERPSRILRIAMTELACKGERLCRARIPITQRVETEHATCSCARPAGRWKEAHVLQGAEAEGVGALERALRG